MKPQHLNEENSQKRQERKITCCSVTLPLGNGQSGMATRRGTGEAGVKNVHYTHRFWMDRVIAHQQGITQEEHQACCSTKWGWGAEKE